MTKDDSNSNSVQTVLKVSRTSSGTPAAGIGVGIDFMAENNANNIKTIGTIDASLSNVAAGGENGEISFTTLTSGTATKAITVKSDGINLEESTATYKINGNDVLSSTTLGSGVTTSSLTTLGTLTSLTVNGDVVISDGENDINIQSHDGSSNGLKLGGTLVTASATELNTMDGVTASKDDINKMVGAQKGVVVNGAPVIYSDQGEIKSTTIEVTKDDGNSNVVSNILTLTHAVSGGNGDNGIGVGISFKAENANGAIDEAGRLEAIFTTATSNNEKGNFRFKVADGASLIEAASLSKQQFELIQSDASYKIDSFEILNKTTLGPTVTTSSLTTVGDLDSLTVSGQFTLNGNIVHDGTDDLSISASAKDVIIESVHFKNGAISDITSLTAGTGTFTSSTESTDDTTGAVVVTGGVGIGGALNVQGQIKTNNNVVSTSDKRWKKDIRTIVNASQALFDSNVRGVYYNFKTDEYKEKGFPEREQIGVIAQEIEKVFPQIVHVDNRGFKSVEYGKISAILIAVANEQAERIEVLRRKQYYTIKQLKRQVELQQCYLFASILMLLLLFPCAIRGACDRSTLKPRIPKLLY